MNSTIQNFLDQIYVRSHSNESVKTYSNCLKKFSGFVDAKYQCSIDDMIAKLQSKEIDVYKMFNELVVYLDKSGLKARSVHLIVTAIKSYLRFVGIKIYTEDFKYAVRLPKKYKNEEIPLTKEIILRILRNVSPKIQAVVLVAVSTGMRVGELVSFRINDIDFKSNPVKIRLRAEITKTRTAREVFLTTEAASALKDYLRRYHNWDEHSNSHSNVAVFGRTSNTKGVYKKDSELRFGTEIAAKMVLQKSLEVALQKIPELDARMDNGKRVVHFHGFRKFFRTTVGNVCGRDFAEALMGHSFYLDTYYLLDEKKKQEMFLDVEPYLTISDFEAVENKMQGLVKELEQQKKILEGLRAEIAAKSIEPLKVT